MESPAVHTIITTPEELQSALRDTFELALQADTRVIILVAARDGLAERAPARKEAVGWLMSCMSRSRFCFS